MGGTMARRRPGAKAAQEKMSAKRKEAAEKTAQVHKNADKKVIKKSKG